jgi:hypothetical protein
MRCKGNSYVDKGATRSKKNEKTKEEEKEKKKKKKKERRERLLMAKEDFDIVHVHVVPHPVVKTRPNRRDAKKREGLRLRQLKEQAEKARIQLEEMSRIEVSALRDEEDLRKHSQSARLQSYLMSCVGGDRERVWVESLVCEISCSPKTMNSNEQKECQTKF